MPAPLLPVRYGVCDRCCVRAYARGETTVTVGMMVQELPEPLCRRCFKIGRAYIAACGACNWYRYFCPQCGGPLLKAALVAALPRVEA